MALLIALSTSATAGGPAPTHTVWVTQINDQFNGDAVPSHWRRYDGPYNSDPHNCASPDHVTVSNGVMHMLMRYEESGDCGPGWYTSGLMLASEYGSIDQRITVRWRVVRRGASSHHIIPMRFADDSPWPHGGEEDFCEATSTKTCSTFLHYGSDESTQVMYRYRFDQTQWHTLRFVRRNLTVSAYIDDLSAPVWTYQGSAETLPETFKRTVLQQECPVRGCPRRSSGFEDIQIDWITVERPA